MLWCWNAITTCKCWLDPVTLRGCARALRIERHDRLVRMALEAAGVVCDLRPPNVIRVAPTPLYNTFHECWAFAEILREVSARR